jgi:hypothetical protein
MKRQLVHILPDANQAMHFKRLDQIDWLSLANAKQVVIHIAPIYLTELESQKVHNKSLRLRDRAGDSVKWMAKLADEPDPITLRSGVELRFITNEPTIDLAAEKLNPQIADDILIAAALELAATTTDPVCIASDDTGIKVKLRSRAVVSYLALDAADKLAVEEEADQKELRELRAEMARMKSRTPKLVVTAKDGKEFVKFDAITPKAELLSLADVKKKYPLSSTPPASTPAPARTGKFDLASLGVHSAAARNEAIEHYYARYAAYQREYADYLKQLGRMFTTGFRLSNEGRGLASKIDVVITFPSIVRVRRIKDHPKVPKEPEPPRRGSLAGAFAVYDPVDLDLLTPHLPREGAPFIRRDENAVEYSVSDLKHDYGIELDPILIVFEDGVEPQSFSADYTAHCVDTDAFRGTINFVLNT